jgi:hypothetical protein
MVTGRREWDEGMLTSSVLPHDAAEVHKIRLSDRMDDTIAWFYERIGLFTVRSAYKLAVALDQKEEPQGASSTRPDGSRSLCNGIWRAKVPPKVRVFAWRLA